MALSQVLPLFIKIISENKARITNIKMKINRKSEMKKTLKLKKAPRSEESSLNKAVKNVTEILKKNEKEEKVEVKPTKEENIIKINKGKKSSSKSVTSPTLKRKTERGVVYIGHIPHGFYEEQMKQYFSQFGRVTNVRVSRSKKTGKSKGYGFIEFLHPEVAKIAAESMNNYLMHNRLVKAEYIPPEKQHDGYFKGGIWSAKKCPKLQKRVKRIKKMNGSIPNKNHKLFVKKSVKNLTKLSEKLKLAGIDLNIKLGDVKI